MNRPLRVLAATPVALLTAALMWHAVPTSQAATGDWTEVWSDQFNGPAGQRVDPANWTPQLGTSYPGGAPNWGTGEVEVATDSPANASTDGAGHAADVRHPRLARDVVRRERADQRVHAPAALQRPRHAPRVWPRSHLLAPQDDREAARIVVNAPAAPPQAPAQVRPQVTTRPP